MVSHRIGNQEGCHIYINDCFMLRGNLSNSKTLPIQKQPFVSKDFIDDQIKTVEIIMWDGDIIKTEASSVYELLLSIGKEVKQTPQMKKIISRLKKKIHNQYY